ncbi:hypothetical protein LVJ94_53145 [Pendulispora rubella]|uniref:Uncharacterized protein n=1 Tax=Pendulispora rubella TaxID=2741070 RepID=A0ABZ2L4C7_9BACT
MGVRRQVWAAGILLATVTAGDALAETPQASSVPQAGSRAPSPAVPSASSSRQQQGTGLAVLAGRDAADAAWPLAQQLYARPSLRPLGLDEARARVLAGEDPAADAPTDVRELAETRDAIRGEDAPSRQLLASIARQLHVRGILVVRLPVEAVRPNPTARVFLADAGTFDAASYAPDAPPANGAGKGEKWNWSGTVGSLDRAYGVLSAPAASPAPAPRAAVAASPAGEPANRDGGRGTSRPFYASPWFWGAIGVAALGGVGIFFATRDGSNDTIHLQMQVPR